MSFGRLIALLAVVIAGLAFWFGRPGRQVIPTETKVDAKATLGGQPVAAPARPQNPISQSRPKAKAPFLTPAERERVLSDFKTSHASNLRDLYSDLWPNLQVSRETEEKVINILVNREVELFGKSLAPENGAIASPPDQQTLAAVHEQTKEQLTGALGEEKAKVLEQYQRTLPQRRMIKQFNRISGNLLPSQTQEQLLAIAIEESSKVSVPPGEFSREQVSQILLDQAVKKNDAILARASAILEPEQLRALEQTLQADAQRFTRPAK